MPCWFRDRHAHPLRFQFTLDAGRGRETRSEPGCATLPFKLGFHVTQIREYSMASQPKDAAKQDVIYEVADNVATLTINRPEVQNTISGPMLDSLTKHLLAANED